MAKYGFHYLETPSFQFTDRIGKFIPRKFSSLEILRCKASELSIGIHIIKGNSSSGCSIEML
jgi:hypothetical protein